jgi:tetratricopeptide (TPR) repeat protein
VAGEVEYAFAHALVRDVAYGQIPRPQRAARHELAAAWIEALGGDRLEDRADQVAHHYLSALELRRAAGLETRPLEAQTRVALRRAAERATSLGSTATAVSLWQATLELWPDDDPDFPDIVLGLESTAFSRGESLRDVPAAIANLQRASERFLADGRPEQAAETEVTCGHLAWWGGNAEEANAYLDRAVALVHGLPDSSSKAAVLAERARRLILQGDYEAARPARAEALAVADRLGLKRRKAEVLATLGAIVEGDEGERILREGIALAVETLDLVSIARGYNNLAEHKLRAGELDEVGALYDEVRVWGDRYASLGTLLWNSAQQAGFSYMTGDWDSALEYAQEHLDALSESQTTHYLEGLALAVRGLVRFGRGDTAGGLADHRRTLELSEQHDDPQAVLPAVTTYGLLCLLAGDQEEARMAVARVFPMRLAYWSSALPLAWLLSRLGYEDELARSLAEAEDLTRRSFWGRVAELIAEGRLVEAADMLDESGTHTEAALGRWFAAEQLVARGRRAEADEQLASALAFFRSVGAVRYTREAERLLAQPA